MAKKKTGSNRAAGTPASGLKFQKTLKIANDALELSRQGQQAQALQMLKKAAEREPRHGGIQFNLGLIQCLLHDFEAAAASFRRAIHLDAENFARVAALGTEQFSYGRYNIAQHCFLAAVSFGGETGELLCRLGNVALVRGEDAAAVDYFARAIALEPANAEGYYGLSRCVELTQEQQIALNALQAKDAGNRFADYALGWSKMRAGEFAASFDNFRQANTNSLEKLQIFPAQAASDLAGHAEALRGLLSQDYFTERAGWSNSAASPVFVVGMPGAGTELLSRKLGAHKAVLNTGQSPWFNQQILQMLNAQGHDFNAVVNGLSAADVQEMAQRYLTVQLCAEKGKVLLVDSNPYNFLNLWLIVLLFPNARIINCRRERTQNVLACYFTDNLSQPFTADISASARYYDEYVRLMDFWREVMPTEIYDYQSGDPLDEILALCKREAVPETKNMGLGAWEAQMLTSTAAHYLDFVPAVSGGDFAISATDGALSLSVSEDRGVNLNFGDNNQTESSTSVNNDNDRDAKPFKLNF